MVRVFLLSLFLTAPFFAAAQTGTPCNAYQSGFTPPAGYGAAWNVLGSARELLISGTCTDNGLTLTAGLGNQQHYVWGTGYYFEGSWQPLTFSGASASEGWLIGKGSIISTKPPQNGLFWVGYVCQYLGNEWKCGCRDAACTTPYWQLQQVKYGTSGGPTGTCDTSKWNGVPCPPEAPRSYAVPGGAIHVTNSAELKDAIANSSARDIVLAAGTYDNTTFFTLAAGHRLWSEALGQAVLRAGFKITTSGASFRGIRFDVSESGRTPNTTGDYSIIEATGGGHNLTVMDSWFDGNDTVGNAINITAVNGIKLQRLVIGHFILNGIRIYNRNSSFPIDPNPPPYIADIDVSYIKNPSSSYTGTAEFGIWLGNSAPGAIVERINCHHVDWSCLIPAGPRVNGTIWRDFRLDYVNDHAFYVEHYANDNVYERFVIGPNVHGGIIWEGALENWGWKPTGRGFTVRNGIINTTRAGMIIGPCEGGIKIENIKFLGQCYAAILDNKDAPYGQGHCTSGPVTISGADYSGVPASTPHVKYNAAHFGSGLCGKIKFW